MTSALGKFRRGSDITVPLQYEDHKGNGLDLNNLKLILVTLYYADGVKVNQYTDPQKTGFDDVHIDNATNGEFHVKLQSAKSKKARTEPVWAEVLVKKDDPDWNSGTWQQLLGDEDPAFEIIEGIATHANP